MSKRVPIAFSFIALLLILAFGTCTFLIYEPFWRARNLLKDALLLEPGRSTFADAQDFAKKYQGEVIQVGDTPPNCSIDSCNYRFHLENTWLHHLGLAPPTSFGGRIYVTRDRVVLRELAMGTGISDRYLEAFAVEKENLSADKAVKFVKYLKMPRLGIEIDSSAPLEVQEMAGEFDLKCLIKIAGCKDYQEMFPPFRRLEQMGYILQMQR